MDDLTRHTIETLEQAHLDALLGTDMAQLERLLADDLLHVHYDGRRDDKQSYLEPLRSGAVRYIGFEPAQERQVRILGDTAVVTGDLGWDAKTPDGTVHSGTITYTAVWARRGDDIVQVLWHSSPAAV